jgi:hypothetical protein
MNMKHDISNSDDVIDSRDVIERIDDLENQGELDVDEQAELAALNALQSEAEGYAPDWRYGATLIRDSYFVEYCEEMLKDCGDLPKDIPHYIEIDWAATARNIQVDYTSVEFDGVTYWVR